MQIVIAGAGLGGLTTALSLHAAGFTDIRVFERASELRPIGVGINLLPHAVRELTDLGLADRIANIGVPTGSLAYFNRFGQPIWSEPRGIAAGYHWPQYSVHRGELQMLLLDAVRERLGVGSVRMGAHVERADTDGTVHIKTLSGPIITSADLVVGADGIHSALRKQHYPLEGPPVWNGLVLWRGTAVIKPYLDNKTMIMAGDGEQKFVAYPLVHSENGLTRVNFIAERRMSDSDAVNADWNRPVDPAPIVDLFREWDFDWLDIPGVISAAEQILEYPMVDRNPAPGWTFGKTTLLGDAAHAMYPNGSNGASQAILDARTLAFEVATRASIDEALAAYEDARRPTTTALILSNRELGPEQVMQLAYERAPQGFADIDKVVPRAEREAIAAGYKRAAGFHPDALNARTSLTPPRHR